MSKTKRWLRRWPYVALIGFLIGADTGCITDRIDLVKTDAIRLETRDSQRTRISWVSVKEEQDEVVVNGRVRIRGTYKSGSNGHVDIALIDSEGGIVDETDVRYSPARIARGHSASFTTHFQGNAADYAAVRIRHHATWFHRSSSSPNANENPKGG